MNELHDGDLGPDELHDSDLGPEKEREYDELLAGLAGTTITSALVHSITDDLYPIRNRMSDVIVRATLTKAIAVLLVLDNGLALEN